MHDRRLDDRIVIGRAGDGDIPIAKLRGRGPDFDRLVEGNAVAGVSAEQYGYRPIEFALQVGGRFELAIDRPVPPRDVIG